MASSTDFIDYVCERIAGVGEIRSRKMFGDYMIYVDDRPVLLVCDNTVYVKNRKEAAALMQDAQLRSPYDGAKPHLVLDIDNRDLSCAVVQALLPVTPVPVPRRKIAK